MENITFSFERLSTYQDARRLLRHTYLVINQLPRDETHALASQLQRSIISVVSNIAEGSGRISIKEKAHFIEIAFGSLIEAFSPIQIAADLGYAPQDDFDRLKPQFYSLGRQLNALHKSILSK